jgi:hypothetical protein
MEIRMQMDDEQIQRMQEQSRASTASDVIRDAVAIHSWALGQTLAGRHIGSFEANGTLPCEFSAPVYERIRD